jgi:hypothetical protein
MCLSNDKYSCVLYRVSQISKGPLKCFWGGWMSGGQAFCREDEGVSSFIKNPLESANGEE